MALLMVDSFDHYPNNGQAGKWDTNASYMSPSNGRRGTTGYAYALTKTLTANYTTLIAGFAGKFTGTGAEVLSLYDGTTCQCKVTLTTSTGVLKVYDGNNNLRGTSSAAGFMSGIYRHFQIKLTPHNGSGVCVVKVDNTEVLNVSSQILAISGNNYANKFTVNSGDMGVWDDFYLLDDSGSYNNDFLGDLAVACKYPDGAGNYTQWTASAGSNYQCVDEAQHNSDTDYVSTSTAANKDTYNYEAVNITGTVYGVQVTAIMRKDDAGSRTARIMARVNSSDYAGSTASLSDTYNIVQKIWEKNPNSTNAWAVSEIDSSEFGIELVS